MNIEPLNNPIDPKRQATRTDTQKRVNQATPAPPDTVQSADAPASSSDTVKIDIQSRLVEQLTETVAGMEDSPREDIVEQVRARVREGVYNSPETIRLVAESMLSRDILTD